MRALHRGAWSARARRPDRARVVVTAAPGGRERGRHLMTHLLPTRDERGITTAEYALGTPPGEIGRAHV